MNLSIKRIFRIAALFFLLLGGIVAQKGFAQVPPPPPPPNGGNNNGHGIGGNQGTAGAPINGGLGILLVLGVIYSGKRMIAFQLSKEEKAMDDELFPGI
ncbi:MAG: hypothetical protein HXX13_14425 [Bacteroidetes bacterium]|nr:hypothetical protein [Bacteroidota bacterium]